MYKSILVARWESFEPGLYWYELRKDQAGYYYHSPQWHGILGTSYSDSEAIAYLESCFKTPMRRVKP